jgi:gentisate 1,2-dioxygenase
MTVRSIRPETSTGLKEFYQRVRSKNAAPLWEVLSEIVLPERRPSCHSSLWQYDEMRPLLIESGGLITLETCERRVLVLENPGLPGISQIAQSLYAGLHFSRAQGPGAHRALNSEIL